MVESEEYRARRKREAYLRNAGRPTLVRGPEHRELQARIRSFHARGMTYVQMDRLSGVGERTIRDALEDKRKGIKRRIFTPLMRMPFEEPTPNAWVDSTGTRRRLQAMWLEGYPLRWVAAQAGFGNAGYLQKLVSGFKGTAGVRYDTSLAVARLYDHLAGKQPADYGFDSRTVKFCRAFALKKGCVPRTCWDPDTIDDPEAIPEWTGRCGTVFGWYIHEDEGIPVCQPCLDVRGPRRRRKVPEFSPEKFRAVRLRAGFNLSTLGRLIDADPTSIKYWETGRSKPKVNGKLAEALLALDVTYEEVCE